MALQTSGAISLNDIHLEAGGSSGTTASLNDSDIRGLISKASGAQSSFSEFYGASGEYFETFSSNITWSYDSKNDWYDVEFGSTLGYDPSNVYATGQSQRRIITATTSGAAQGTNHYLRLDPDGNFDWFFEDGGTGFSDPYPIQSQHSNFQTWWDTIDVYNTNVNSSGVWFTINRNNIFDPNTSANIRLSNSSMSQINPNTVNDTKMGSSSNATNFSFVINYNTEPS